MTSLVVLKFINGDMLMGDLVQDDSKRLYILDPIAVEEIKITTERGVSERLVTKAMSLLVEERKWIFEKDKVLWMQSMSAGVVDHYIETVKNVYIDPFYAEEMAATEEILTEELEEELDQIEEELDEAIKKEGMLH